MPEPMSAAEQRLFVAIPFPDQLKPALARLRTPLPGLKWYTDGTLHLTLRFIGQTNAAIVNVISRALSAIRLPAFQLQVKGLGLFSHPRQTILWSGIAPSPQLSCLKQAVDLALQTGGLMSERQAYHPHLTLARYRGCASEQLRALAAQHREFCLDWPGVTQFILYKSELLPQGAVHTPVAVYPLNY